MKTGLSASFCLIVYFLICSSEAQKNIRHENITAEVGQDVILPCKVSNNILITAVEWSRPDQKSEYVLFYRDGHLHPENQHPSYQNRVDLQDKDMKDGNFSMFLKNVTKNDTGIYVCRVFEEGKIDPISNISLVVHLPGEKFDGDQDGIIRDGGNKDGIIRDGGNKDGIIRDGGNKDGGNKTGIIAGSVVGVILLLAVLVSVGFLIYRQYRRQNPNLPVPPDDPAAKPML